LISGNTATEYGGALYACGGPITNCTIVGNFGTYGGDLTNCWGLIANCVIWENRQDFNNVIYGSHIPLFSCLQVYVPGAGCINTDPRFLNPGYWDENGTAEDESDDYWVEGDYHLQMDSPCIDAGNYFYCMQVPSTDLDGMTRMVTAQVDMGCYEYDSTADRDGDWLADTLEPDDADNPDRDGDGIPDGVEILQQADPNEFNPLRVWCIPLDAAGIQEALFFSRSGETIELQEGIYYENLSIGGRNIILTGREPNDPKVVEATIISADIDQNPETANGRVISFLGSEDSTCLLSGLTITGGFHNIGGSGIDFNYSYAHIRDCIVSDNNGWCGGGAIMNCRGSINHCIIRRNHGNTWGALLACNGPIENCIIVGNSGGVGGGLYGCNGPIRNCTIVGNLAKNLLYNVGGGLYGCSGAISNCIIRDNRAEHSPDLYECSKPIFSCVQENGAGLGSIIADPQFVSSGAWDDNGTPGNYVDDTYLIGDYHLQSEAGRWDPNSESWVIDSVTSPCIDAGNPGVPLGEEPLTVPDDPENLWGMNKRINMGAYGGTAEASMGPHGWALLGDLTNDGIVNLEDFSWQAVDWLESAEEQPGDLNRDGIVDGLDLWWLTGDWLDETSWHE